VRYRSRPFRQREAEILDNQKRSLRWGHTMSAWGVALAMIALVILGSSGDCDDRWWSA
jgi:hypothetical protein